MLSFLQVFGNESSPVISSCSTEQNSETDSSGSDRRKTSEWMKQLKWQNKTPEKTQGDGQTVQLDESAKKKRKLIKYVMEICKVFHICIYIYSESLCYVFYLGFCSPIWYRYYINKLSPKVFNLLVELFVHLLILTRQHLYSYQQTISKICPAYYFLLLVNLAQSPNEQSFPICKAFQKCQEEEVPKPSLGPAF